MVDNVNDAVRRLSAIINRKIKQEPVDPDDDVDVDPSAHETLVNNEISRQVRDSNSRQQPASSDPRHSAPGIYEGMRRNFLYKNLNVQNVLSESTAARNENQPKTGSTPRVKSVYERAKAVRNLLSDGHSNAYYALIPPQVQEFSHLRPNHASPVAQNIHNSMFAFQATSETVHEVTHPYSVTTFATQSTAKRIGANLDVVIAAAAKDPQTTVTKSTPSTVAERQVATPTLATSRKVDSAVQTGNTGSFILEIPCEELTRLSTRQRDLLLQVMQEFKVKDSRKSSEMLERLNHRQRTLNGQSNRRERLDTRSSGPPLY